MTENGTADGIANIFHDRKLWPSQITPEQLSKLMLAIAEEYQYPTIAEDNTFDRESEDWKEMVELLHHSYICVFNSYFDTRGVEATAILVLSPTLAEHHQLWVAEGHDLSKLKLVQQGEEMRA